MKTARRLWDWWSGLTDGQMIGSASFVVFVVLLSAVVVLALWTENYLPGDHAFNVCRESLMVDYVRDGYGESEAWLLATDAAPGLCP